MNGERTSKNNQTAAFQFYDFEFRVQLAMGAHGSKEKLTRSASERYVQHKLIEQERERFGRFGKRARGNCIIQRIYSCLQFFICCFFCLVWYFD